MSCDREGNRRSGVALAMRHRLKWFIRLRAQDVSKGDEQPTNTPHGVWYSLPLPCGTGVTLVNEVALHRARLVSRWVTVSRVCGRMDVNHGEGRAPQNSSMAVGWLCLEELLNEMDENCPHIFKNTTQNSPKCHFERKIKFLFWAGRTLPSQTPPAVDHSAPQPNLLDPPLYPSRIPHRFTPLVIVAFISANQITCLAVIVHVERGCAKRLPST